MILPLALASFISWLKVFGIFIDDSEDFYFDQPKGLVVRNFDQALMVVENCFAELSVSQSALKALMCIDSITSYVTAKC